MSLYTYVDTPNTSLVCCICRTPFTEPTTTLTCTHTFCRECILRALTHAPLCPVDRSPLAEADLTPADPIVRSLVEELEVECVHRASGCEYTCQRQSLPAHLRDKCLYSQVECEEVGCGMVVMRADFEVHQRERHGASEAKHGEASQSDDDNDDDDKDVSEAKNAGRQTSPEKTEEGQQRTIELLMEQNMLLRHRVEIMEGAMQVMKKEMSAMRSALGPWFRMPNGSSAGSPGHSQRPRVQARTEQGVVLSPMGVANDDGRFLDNDHETNGASATTSLAAGGPATINVAPTSVSVRASQQIHTGHGGILSLPGDGGDGRADPLAGYFPTLGEFGMSMAQQQMQFGGYMQQQQQAMNSVSGVGGGPGGLQINPQAVTGVAPLDLGTNLVGTLEGLRESVVGVAAGIDSLGRRSEIALANETLRLGEEVVSLRGAVHGLRMQIHAMMMERNAQVTDGAGVGSSWMGLGFNPPNMNSPPSRMYSYGGPPNITKL